MQHFMERIGELHVTPNNIHSPSNIINYMCRECILAVYTIVVAVVPLDLGKKQKANNKF